MNLIKKTFSVVGGSLAFLLFFIFSTLSRIFTLILGWLKIGSILCLSNKIQTPIIHLEHPITKRKVVLVGMIHIGIPSYFKSIQKCIESQTDSKILYEGINRLDEKQKRHLTSAERSFSKKLKQSSNTVQFYGDSHDLEDQMDSLSYHPHWIRTDMDELDIIRRFVETQVVPENVSSKKSNSITQSNEAVPEITAFLFDWALYRIPILMYIKGLKNSEKIMDRILITERNLVAYEAIRFHSKDSDIVSIWGCSHLVGLTKHLKDEGYYISHKNWVTAHERDRWLFFKFIKSAFTWRSRFVEKLICSTP